MPVTGRRYLRIDRAIDERRDPIASTRAAAEFLKENYEVLGTWPLAITAYNHGRAGMVRAVSTVGSTDLMEIIARYHGPAFKFASRNFYAEFIAALEAEREFPTHFGAPPAEHPLRADTVTVPDTASLTTLARASRTDTEVLADLNPALAPAVVTGRVPVPKGYRLRLPAGSASTFSAQYAALVRAQKQRLHRVQYVHHRVRSGQTLAAIAKRYRTTVAAIRRTNRLGNPLRLRAGQSLVIPTG